MRSRSAHRSHSHWARTVPPRLFAAVVCLSLVVAAAVLDSQQQYRERGAFLRQWPVIPASKTSFDAWLAAVREHEPGLADAALWTVLRMPPAQVSGIVGIFIKNPNKDLNNAPLPPDTLQRAVILHTDIATMDLRRTIAADALWTYPIASVHFGVAQDLVDARRFEAGRDAFVRLWYRATAALLVSQREVTAAPRFLPEAIVVCRGEGAVALLAGAAHELLASPRVQQGADMQGIARQGADENYAAADRFYRQALRWNDRLTEARLHLARVLGFEDRHEEALVELKRAAAEPTSPPIRYLIQLVLGEEEEALGHRDAAGAAYRRALDLFPHAQSAYLALSRCERGAGNRAASALAVQHLFERPLVDEAGADPWTDYFSPGDAQRAGALLDELRAPFRRRQ